MKSKNNKFIHLLFGKGQGIFIKKVAALINFEFDSGDMYLKRHNVQMQVMANAGKMINAPYISVFT